ncbi:MAG: 30S ribosomal protein S6 [Myxococcales bacterium]|nr:30S ribosomal protein S6 [Polyangiaceae bacterium]MDW8251297.1 30S ribosomal protein S6 [Myxococcales bacterium]
MTNAPANRAREYETIYILRPDIDPDAAERVAARINEVIEREQGKLLKVENWGRRKLAYQIDRHKRGVYTYVRYLGGGALVKELERNLRLLDTVIRHQTVLLRSNVLVDSISVDPEETKFTRLELPTEEDKDESKERLLGFLDPPEDRRTGRRDGDFDEFDDIDSDENLNPDLVDTSDGEDK